MFRVHHLLSAFLLFLALPGLYAQRPGQQPPGDPGLDTPQPKSTDEVIASGLVELPNAEMSDIVIEYQQRTGTHPIIDASAAGTTLTIVSNPDIKMTNDQAIDFIETTLLLNGISIIPVRDGIVKFINNGTKAPAQEGIPVYSAPLDPLVAEGENLPQNEEVISYVMRFKHIGPEAAAELFLAVVPVHPYGLYQPVPEAGALIITENVPTIRQLIEMKAVIDVDPGKFTQKVVALERADAESVAGIVQEIITARTAQRNGGAAGGNNRRAQAPNRNVPANDGAAALAAALQGGNNPQNNRAAAAGAPDDTNRGIPDESSIILQAIPRLNSILVFARPTDISWIEGLIADLDAEAQFKKFRTYQLRFIPVTDFLQVAVDTIARGVDETLVGGGGGGSTTGSTQRNTSNTRNVGNSFGGGNTTGSNAFGTGNTTGGTTGGVNSSFGGGTSSIDGGAFAFQAPISQTIGKTLLIADPTSNNLVVSGPPDQLATIDELILTIDKRPRQVYISAIIAQITLGDDINTGIDLLRQVDDFEFLGSEINSALLLRGASAGIIDPVTALQPILQRIITDTAGDPVLDADGNFTFTNVLDQFGNTVPNPNASGIDLFPGGQNAAAGVPFSGGLNAYLTGGFFGAYVNALESTNQFRVLARPSVFTANNSQASLISGQQIPVPTSTQSTVVAGGTQSLNSNISFRDITLELQVTPLINSDDEVTLQIAQANNTVSGTTIIDGNAIPNISTQQLTTSVSIPNGGIAILGGLIQEQKSENASGLPILARIPILNLLAGSKASSLSRNELMVFIQANIVDSTTDLIDLNIDEARRTVVSQPALEFANPPRDPDEVLRPELRASGKGTDEIYPEDLPEKEKRGLKEGIRKFFRIFKPVTDR